MKQFNTDLPGSGPVVNIATTENVPGIRILHEGTSGNALEIVRPDGTVLWSVDHAGTPSAGGAGGGSARVGSTVAALNTPAPTDGTLGFLRVGTWPDVEYVELTYDGTASKWVSKAQALVSQTDQTYMGVNTTTYSYIQYDHTGSATAGGMGWTTRPIFKASSLLTAGLSLQASFSGIIADATTAFTVMPRFFAHNSGDVVTFSSDGSTAAAELGTALASDGAGTSVYKFQSTGWQSVVKISTANPLVAADVTQSLLWPRLYGKVVSGAGYGQLIDADLQVRWVA